MGRAVTSWLVAALKEPTVWQELTDLAKGSRLGIRTFQQFARPRRLRDSIVGSWLHIGLVFNADRLRSLNVLRSSS